MKEQVKKQIEKLKEDMSDLQKTALEASVLDLILLGITGWAICPLIMISGLFAKLYYCLKKKKSM